MFMLSNLLSARGLSQGGNYIILCAMRLQLSTVTPRVIDCTLCSVDLLHHAVRPREIHTNMMHSVLPGQTDALQALMPFKPIGSHI